MTRGLVLSRRNRWEHFRATAVLQLRILERDNAIPESVAADLRTAIYEADQQLNSTVFRASEVDDG